MLNMKLEGLSPVQCIIADALWECSSKSEMQLILQTFPLKEIVIVREMMLAAAIDSAVNDNVEIAKDYLSRFRT